jgi:hypothetical protein
MRSQNVIRVVLFVIFFSIGASALGISILCDDLLRYYHSKQLLKAAEESIGRLQSLNTDYGVLLQHSREDPNFIQRVAPATLGTRPEDQNTFYPTVTEEHLTAAKKVLSEKPSREPPESITVNWITRCSEPPRRTILFLAGAFLVLISFVWFSSARQKSKKN